MPKAGRLGKKFDWALAPENPHGDEWRVKSAVREVDVEVLPPETATTREHALARLLAFILDDLIPIPGTKFRVGLDPIIGLIPGLGDTSTTAVASLVLVQAVRAGVPRIVLARMALNMLINGIMGAVPGVGDVFSAWFKSNRMNYRLLVKHTSGGRRSTAGDWAFLIVLLTVVAAVILVSALAVGYLAYRMAQILFGWQ